VRDRYAMGRRVLSATPSEDAIVLMLDAAGYEVEHRTDWASLVAGLEGPQYVPQYRRGERVTFRARRRRRRGRLAGREAAPVDATL